MDLPDSAPVGKSDNSPDAPPSAVAGAFFLTIMFFIALFIAFGASHVFVDWIKAVPIIPPSRVL